MNTIEKLMLMKNVLIYGQKITFTMMKAFSMDNYNESKFHYSRMIISDTDILKVLFSKILVIVERRTFF